MRYYRLKPHRQFQPSPGFRRVLRYAIRYTIRRVWDGTEQARPKVTGSYAVFP